MSTKDISLLEVRDLEAFYGTSYVLQGVSFALEHGECLGVLGRNGVGKTTLLKSILGLVSRRTGSIIFKGKEISSLQDYRIAREGVGYVPQRDVVFPDFTVLENLWLGGAKSGERFPEIDFALEIFPRLRERLSQRAGSMSGGERQMLAIARALVGGPSIILLDEPTSGLMPAMVSEVSEAIAKIMATGVGVLLVEQNIRFAIGICNRVVVLSRGRVGFSGTIGVDSEAEIFEVVGL